MKEISSVSMLACRTLFAFVGYFHDHEENCFKRIVSLSRCCVSRPTPSINSSLLQEVPCNPLWPMMRNKDDLGSGGMSYCPRATTPVPMDTETPCRKVDTHPDLERIAENTRYSRDPARDAVLVIVLHSTVLLQGMFRCSICEEGLQSDQKEYQEISPTDNYFCCQRVAVALFGRSITHMHCRFASWLQIFNVHGHPYATMKHSLFFFPEWKAQLRALYLSRPRPETRVPADS